ncbi:DUF1365 domain-containing protein [Motilimonas pumila]|uniref:DUF1365 domain-containing protein n=1 Tax=Motilimonas pumila TaxID=2303987 RepID=A0A418YFH5_9GAMM|nr:DUF1365 domain-containing protein [Motilimonas pumila]RJG48136.1 DUF1365 domain-containing protein [Motilimonas pumila]
MTDIGQQPQAGEFNSCIYTGVVRHRRFAVAKHEFSYKMFLLALDLDELPALQQASRWFKVNRFAPLSFRCSDYLTGKASLTRQDIWEKVSQLGGAPLDGKVIFIGQMRCFGIYFSPINMYYCYKNDDELVYLLAEVSNTPWNQRHYYLIDIENQPVSDKDFHVSPFMDLAMKYHWRIKAPGKQLSLHIENHNDTKVFDASLNMQRTALNNDNLRRSILSIPAMTVKTVCGIYWQALKLYLKKVPYIAPPEEKEADNVR